MTDARPMFEPCRPCGGTGVEGGSPAGSFMLTRCEDCNGTGRARIRCSQCWNWKDSAEFLGKSGRLIKRCRACQDRYRGWEKKSPEERAVAADPRRGLVESGEIRVALAIESGNRKTGRIPVSMTSAGTCPSRCEFRSNGCFAEQHMTGIHWRRLSRGDSGMSWLDFCLKIARLPDGQIWRHNEAGDLPGDGTTVDQRALRVLVNANRGKRGFTYTHYPLGSEAGIPGMPVVGRVNADDSQGQVSTEIVEHNLVNVRRAVEDGFTINVSTGTLEEADTAMDLGLPTTVVLPLGSPHKGLRTPMGRTVVLCPAERVAVTCERCGLCAVAGRKSIVGFIAHGLRKGLISERKRQLPLFGG